MPPEEPTMSSNSHRERRSGLYRLRMATASLGIAAILGTGALTLTMGAQEDATTTVESTVAESPTSSDESTTEDASASASSMLESDDSDSESDASSGGS
jgi:cytoskeletal protein RodZ